jgi:hypothetical protein
VTNKQLITTLLVSAVLVSAGCTSKLEYDSHPDAERLRALQNKPVLILQFDYKEDVLVDDEPLDRSLGDKVAAQQKASFMSQFGSFFVLKDVSQNVADRYGKTTDFGDSAFAGRVMRDFGGDGGFVITTAYGYKMVAGSLKDRIPDEGLKKVLPKKAVGVLKGPSQVQSYDFASKTTLLNSEGHVVWSFYGKASAMPTFSTMFNPAEFARSVAGLDPSVQNLALKMSQISDGYNQYLSWMIQQDLNGVRAKNYFHDYPSDQKNKYLSIFPAETKSYVPFVRGYSPLE